MDEKCVISNLVKNLIYPINRCEIIKSTKNFAKKWERTINVHSHIYLLLFAVYFSIRTTFRDILAMAILRHQLQFPIRRRRCGRQASQG